LVTYGDPVGGRDRFNANEDAKTAYAALDGKYRTEHNSRIRSKAR
jgi:hypothetical protein